MAELLKFPMMATFIDHEKATIVFEKFVGSYPFPGTRFEGNEKVYIVARVVVGTSHNRLAVILDEETPEEGAHSTELQHLLTHVLEHSVR